MKARSSTCDAYAGTWQSTRSRAHMFDTDSIQATLKLAAPGSMPLLHALEEFRAESD